MTIAVFWGVTPCIAIPEESAAAVIKALCPGDGSSRFLRNVGMYLTVYTASFPRRQLYQKRLIIFPLWFLCEKI
jgi:hypothetical protein